MPPTYDDIDINSVEYIDKLKALCLQLGGYMPGTQSYNGPRWGPDFEKSQQRGRENLIKKVYDDFVERCGKTKDLSPLVARLEEAHDKFGYPWVLHIATDGGQIWFSMFVAILFELHVSRELATGVFWEWRTRLNRVTEEVWKTIYDWTDTHQRLFDQVAGGFSYWAFQLRTDVEKF